MTKCNKGEKVGLMNPKEVIAVHREMTEGYDASEGFQTAASGLFLCVLLFGAVLLLLALLTIGDEPPFAELTR